MVLLLVESPHDGRLCHDLASTHVAYDESLGGAEGSQASRRTHHLNTSINSRDNTNTEGVVLHTAGQSRRGTAVIMKQALRHIEQTLRAFDEVLEGDEPLTHLKKRNRPTSWHVIAV